MIRGEFSGGSPWARYHAHGDPFPLAPSWVSSCLEQKGISLPQRGEWSAKALNNLALHESNLDFDSELRGTVPNAPQVAITQRMVSAFEDAGPAPSDLDGVTALGEMATVQDLYHEEPANLAPYDVGKVKVLHSDLQPRNLQDMVPRFVKGILSRFDSMIERSASDLAQLGPCPIKPYWDPTLRRSPSLIKDLVVRLAQKGLMSFRTGIKERIGIFCVKKKTPQWNRLIIDARRCNWSHQPPPAARLATPRAFLDVQYPNVAPGEACAVGLEADVSDCFYNYIHEPTASWFGVDLPLTCGEWKRLGWAGGSIYSDETQSFFTPSESQLLYPVFRGLCMGWSWALFLANEAVAYAVAGRVERPLGEVRDKLPPPDVSHSVITGVYVDNISIIGTSVQAVSEACQKIKSQFDSDHIPLTWSHAQPARIFETIGVIFDFEKGVARNKPRRIWRAFLAGKELLRRRRVSGRHVEVWLGHMTSLFMLLPSGLSCFFHIYRFVQQHRNGRTALWESVKREIKLALGLVWLAQSSLKFDPIHQVDAGDASGHGFALMTTWASRSEISEACRWREGWRFRAMPQVMKEAVRSRDRHKILEALDELHEECFGPIAPQELKPSAQFGAGLRTQFAAWLEQSSDSDHWLRTSAISSQMRAKPGKRVMVELPAMVPPLDDSLCDGGRFTLLWRRRWRNPGKGHITLKEARVALSSLKRTCRVTQLHGRVKLTLTDNLSCLCAFEKGRATNFHLNQVCRTAAAYAAACGIRWRLRHIETKRNPADRDSRLLSGHKPKSAAKMPFDRGKVKSNHGLCSLPSSSSSVRASGTAVNGREHPLLVRQHKPCESEALDLRSLRDFERVRTEGEAKPSGLGIDSSMSCSSLSIMRSKSSQSPSGKSPNSRGLFLEIFAGTGRLTQAVGSLGLSTLPPIEIKAGGHFDMRRRSTQRVVLAWLRSGRVSWVHLGTPCTVFSRARRFIRHKQRAEEKERVGVELALFTAEVIMTCNRYSVTWSLENPRSSRLFQMPFLGTLLSSKDSHVVDIDLCRYGQDFKKPTRVFSSCSLITLLGRTCNHTKHMTQLRGSEVRVVDGKKQSVPKTQAAGAYPQQLADQWAQIIAPHVAHADSSRDLLGMQWVNELKSCVKTRDGAEKPICTTPGQFHQIGQLQAKFKGLDKAIVFGQHSKQEAQHREKVQQEISKLKGPFKPSGFFEKEFTQTPAAESVEG